MTEPEVVDLKRDMEKWMIHPIAYGDQHPKPDIRWLSFSCAGYRDWMGRFMAEGIRVANVEGYHFDATPFAQHKGWPLLAGDIGPEAAADFKKKTGYDAPQREDWNSQVFREWVKWRYNTSVDFFEAVTTAAQEEKSHAAVAMIYNMHNVDWHLGLTLRRSHPRAPGQLHGVVSRDHDALGEFCDFHLPEPKADRRIAAAVPWFSRDPGQPSYRSVDRLR